MYARFRECGAVVSELRRAVAKASFYILVPAFLSTLHILVLLVKYIKTYKMQMQASFEMSATIRNNTQRLCDVVRLDPSEE